MLGNQWGFINLLTKEETMPQWSEPWYLHSWDKKTSYETSNYFCAESHWGTCEIETMVLFRADEFSRSAVKVQIGKTELWMPNQNFL